MLDLTLIDAFALLYIIYRVARARSRSLGDSLHDLVALLLLIALVIGLRMTSELRQLLDGVAVSMQAVPGLGSKLLVIVGAWYLMRLLRKRSGYWIENAIPRRLHRHLAPVTEGVRALLLVAFLAWLVEGWFDGPRQATPKLVQAVRVVDAWLVERMARTQHPSPPPGALR
jgi:hypothetical protein